MGDVSLCVRRLESWNKQLDVSAALRNVTSWGYITWGLKVVCAILWNKCCYISLPNDTVARAAISIAATSSKCVSEIKAFNWNEIMNGNMWHLCQHGVEASKDFNHLFNTPMPRTVTDVPRSPDVTLVKQAGWYPWAVRLWICGRGPTMYSKLMSRMHACLQMYVPMHNTFKAPGQWKT